MPYSENDLKMFVPITDKRLLVGTAYFELHQGELPTQYACWLDDSLFIQDAAFDFFELCFQNAIAEFDYFSFNRATPSQVAQLSVEVGHFLATVAKPVQRELLFSRLVAPQNRTDWDPLETDQLRRALLVCGKAIEDYVNDAKENGAVLNVLGM